MRLGFDLHGAVPGILGIDACVTPICKISLSLYFVFYRHN